MNFDPFCGGCGCSSIATLCQNSFSRIGVIKVHWECWSACNLSCPFCYRTRGVPLDAGEAMQLIRAIRTSGASCLVFAGGDPSLRADIYELVSFAKVVGLRVEIQTNSHFVGAVFAKALECADLIGLSIDGSCATVHDEFRQKAGNFVKVLKLLDWLTERNIPVLVRTMVGIKNAADVPQIADLLAGRDNVVRWSLLEFSPVGDGLRNRSMFELNRSVFDETAKRAVATNVTSSIDVFTSEKKAGTYLLITPAGDVYGVTETLENDHYPIIGSILKCHLNELAMALPFSKGNHETRYGIIGMG